MTVAELAALRALHDRLPLSDPDRHDLDDPQLADAFAHLAMDHPENIPSTAEEATR